MISLSDKFKKAISVTNRKIKNLEKQLEKERALTKNHERIDFLAGEIESQKVKRKDAILNNKSDDIKSIEINSSNKAIDCMSDYYLDDQWLTSEEVSKILKSSGFKSKTDIPSPLIPKRENMIFVGYYKGKEVFKKEKPLICSSGVSMFPFDITSNKIEAGTITPDTIVLGSNKETGEIIYSEHNGIENLNLLGKKRKPKGPTGRVEKQTLFNTKIKNTKIPFNPNDKLRTIP